MGIKAILGKMTIEDVVDAKEVSQILAMLSKGIADVILAAGNRGTRGGPVN